MNYLSFFIYVALQVVLLFFLQATESASLSWKLGEFVLNTVAILTALGVLWKYTKTARTTLAKVDSALPIIFEIAKEFNPKEGGGLRQVIDGMRTDITSIRAKTHLLLEQSLIPIFLMDEKGRCRFVNSAWIAITGITNERALGHGWTTAVHDDDKQRVFAEFKAIATDNRPLYIEFRFVNEAEHKIHHVRAKATSIEEDLPPPNKEKRLVGFVGQLKVLRTEVF